MVEIGFNLKIVNNNGCVIAHKTETYKLRYSNTCDNSNPNHLWEIPESGTGIWRNVGTKYYIKFNGSSLITIFNKSETAIMEDINGTSIVNSIWVKDSSSNKLCSYASGDKILFQQCDKNNKNQRWFAVNKDPVKTTTIIDKPTNGSNSN